MLRNLSKLALILAFVLALFLTKEMVMVGMSLARVEMYLPTSWLPHAPYLILAALIFPILAWPFVKLFRKRTIALGLACSLAFLAVHLIFVYQSQRSGDSYLILANTGLAISFVLWVIVLSRLTAPVDNKS